MKLAFLAFTEKGFALAGFLAQTLGGSVMRCGKPDSLSDWTKKHFAEADGLVFVGAVGIAVRAIAPYIEKKWKDPAVVAVDECACFAIPLLSGHLGGANRLARAISQVCGAQAVAPSAKCAGHRRLLPPQRMSTACLPWMNGQKARTFASLIRCILSIFPANCWRAAV